MVLFRVGVAIFTDKRHLRHENGPIRLFPAKQIPASNLELDGPVVDHLDLGDLRRDGDFEQDLDLCLGVVRRSLAGGVPRGDVGDVFLALLWRDFQHFVESSHFIIDCDFSEV